MSPTVSHLGHLVPSWLDRLGGCRPVGGEAKPTEVGHWGRPLRLRLPLLLALLSFPGLSWHAQLLWPTQPCLQNILKVWTQINLSSQKGTVRCLCHPTWESNTSRYLQQEDKCLSLWGLSFWSLVKERSGGVNVPLKPQMPSRLQALRELRIRHGSFGSFTTEPSC